MSVFLCSSDDGLNGREAAAWVPVASNAACPPRYRVLPNLAKRLEQAFTESRDIWWQLARELQATPSAHLAHAVSCNSGPSDLGTMLAWSRLVDQLAADRQNYIVRCDDPWLFRHLATRPGVTGDSAPPLLGRRLRLLARGYFSRIGVAAAACREHLRHRAGKARMPAGRAAIVVYGHPRSDADGGDAYFADLMARIPDVVRLLHTDCRGPLGTELAAHRRTVSLHAWGRLRSVAALPFARWRPSPRERSSTYGWLVRRAADLEAATGTGAQLSWQAACQSRWLSETRPRAVAWPWENHTWERSLVSAARQVGAATFGYQHTVVGHHMYNLSPAALVDGEQDLPDRIIANGPLFVDDMERLGVPKGRIQMGGALRFTIGTHGADNYDPDGAVYVALPSARSVADEIVDAVAETAARRRELQFLVKDHPMYPYPLRETANLKRTPLGFAELPKIATAVYAASTVGLEAVLAGIPTVRFVPAKSIAMDILPSGIDVCEAAAADLAAVLPLQSVPGRSRRNDVFSAPDWRLWQEILGDGVTA